jgi:hypothetical protein
MSINDVTYIKIVSLPTTKVCALNLHRFISDRQIDLSSIPPILN